MLSRQVATTDIDGNKKWELDYYCKPAILETLEIHYKPDVLAKTLERNAQNNGPENDVYFYHGDHLGSANWITDYSGAPIQYIHYAPYGELIENQMSYLYDERYKFTGKERDAETGYDFFGARFYSSLLPSSGIFSYTALSPVRIETEGFALKTDSGSLNINFTKSFNFSCIYQQKVVSLRKF